MKYPDMISQMDVSAFIVVFAQALAFVSVILLLALLVETEKSPPQAHSVRGG